VKNFASARECTEQIQDLAARTSDEIICFFADFAAGYLSNMSGDYVSARDYFERTLNLTNDIRRGVLINPYSANAFINHTGQLSLTLWMLGYPEQARNQQVRVLDLLGESIGAYAQGNGIGHELQMSDFMRDDRRMLEAAERLVALARESGITAQLGIGMIWLGRAMAVEGGVERGIKAVAGGRDILLKLGEVAVLDLNEHTAAAAYLAAGKTDEGLAIVERLIEEFVAGGVRFYEADLYRLKGELLLAAGAPLTDAEDSFR
jgi:tetratricopeptide (TPR) repeat protein